MDTIDNMIQSVSSLRGDASSSSSSSSDSDSSTITGSGPILGGLVQQANGLFDGSGRLLTDSSIVQSINSAIEAAGGSNSIVGGFIEVGPWDDCQSGGVRACEEGRRERGGEGSEGRGEGGRAWAAAALHFLGIA